MSDLRRRGRAARNTRHEADQGEEIAYKTRIWALPPFLFLLLLLSFGALLLILGVHLNDKLPSKTATPHLDITEFSPHNALRYLNGLVEIGPKVTGSVENEVGAVNYLTNIIFDIMKKTTSKHNITYDLQKASGELSLKFLTKEVDLVYRNVQNVIVKIGPKGGSPHSLLVNCHFDSVPESPGASDDGLNCAVMLEILRTIAVSHDNLQHNVIFLFNGAEENPLLASHGFVTQHKWAKEVKAFINLESCGAGGPETLFQAAPDHPWLIKSYAKAAKYPHGIVVAEEIFQSGLIPSDTDFRIFRDYGGLPGLDFAHCKNGHVYHTRFDNIHSIDNILGVIQHTGENIRSLIREILKSKDVENPQPNEKGKRVYFDVFGFFFINYSHDTGKAINSLVVIFAIAGYYITAYHQHSWSILRNFCPMAFSALSGTVLSLLYNLLLAFFLDIVDVSMSWYTNKLIILPLYVLPALIIMLLNIMFFGKFDKSKITLNIKLKSYCISILLFWTTLLFLGTFLDVRSTYILMLQVLFPSLYVFISSFMRPAPNRVLWTVLFVLTTIPSSLYLTYLGIAAFRLFIPITGRAGFERNPEFIISIFSTILAIGVFSYISTMVLAVSRRWSVIITLITLHISSIFFIAFSSYGFPFSVEVPQRVLVTHVNRQFFDANALKRSDSLFWVQNMDRRSRNVLNVLNNAPLLDEFCADDGYCGLPWFSKFQERSASSCVSSAPHTLGDEVYLEINERTAVSKSQYHFNFTISGPDHMGVILTPSPNVSLKSWNLPGDVSTRSTFMIGYVHGLQNRAWNLHFDLEVANSSVKRPLIKVEVYGLYFHHKQHFSLNFAKYISQFPKWSHVSPSLATYKSYLF